MSAAIADLPLVASGKVREIYDMGDRLLMVASDRISTYDVVHPNPIPDKGKVLTGLSAFWFAKTGHIVANHYESSTEGVPAEVRGRAMVVRKLQMLPVECVVRGYLSGSAWVEYRRAGTVCGQPLPPGLVESERLPEPIFTPATKEDEGHDENISTARMAELIGADLALELERLARAIYAAAAEYAEGRGIIIADTKMEFGLLEGQPILIDELLTPDSSRFWEADRYEPGRPQDSLDKQPLRDWLTASGWNREPPAPSLPPDVVARIAAKYAAACERLTGQRIPL